MDFRQSLREYQQRAAQVRAMESQLHEERQARLAGLPAEFGYTELAGFIKALREAAALGAPQAAKSARNPVPSATPPPILERPSQSPSVGGDFAPSPSPLGIGLARSARQQAATAVPAGGAVVASAQRVVFSAPVPAPAKPEASRVPTGTSLEDPANFGQMPDFALLERGTLEASAHRAQLADALRFATKVLHTSKVPAPVWREWRQFERQVMEAMRVS